MYINTTFILLGVCLAAFALTLAYDYKPDLFKRILYGIGRGIRIAIFSLIVIVFLITSIVPFILFVIISVLMDDNFIG